MEIRRGIDGNSMTGYSEKVFRNPLDYIRMIVDVYSASDIRRDLWLTPREKDFFIVTVFNVLEGNVNPIGESATQIYKKLFGPTTNKVKISDYINRVRKKEWVRYNKQTKVVEIPPIFHNMNLGNDRVSFSLNFRLADG